MCRDYSTCLDDRQPGLDAVPTSPCLEALREPVSSLVGRDPVAPAYRTAVGFRGHLAACSLALGSTH